MTETMNQFIPDYLSHPGETLLELLESLEMSQVELARRIGRTQKHINEIVQGQTHITAETALLLEQVIQIPASFWMEREKQYQEAKARLQEQDELSKHVDWLNNFPLTEIKKRKWLESYDDAVLQLKELLRFFGVANIKGFEAIWQEQGSDSLVTLFRQQAGRKSNPYAIATWLRKGQLEAQQLECDIYTPTDFRAQLLQIRQLTVQKVEDVWAEVKTLAAQAGVAVVAIQELPNTGVFGATYWWRDKPVIQLSLHYKTNDHFWFSFFHEAGHILKHGKRAWFLEGEQNTGEAELEKEANEFAANFLIPAKEYDHFVARNKGRISLEQVKAFARQLHIAEGIVVGRLQHDKYLPKANLNGLKERVNWSKSGEIISLPS